MMSFCVPILWLEQKDYFSDYYFWMTKISGFLKKTKSKIKYPDCNSAIKPVPYSNKYPVPEPLSVLPAFDSESEASTNAGQKRFLHLN